MDEPLSNLDAKLRVQMRGEIARLQYDIGTTTIYVTHDQVEAMTMGHRVAVMNAGLLQQIDTPQQLYDEPANVFVAGFIGTPPMNLFVAGLSVDRRSGGADRRRPAGPARRRGRGEASAAARLRRRQRRRWACAARTCTRAPRGPSCPPLNAQLLNVEALGSETIAYLRLDAESIGFHADEEEEALAGAGEAESIVAAQAEPRRLVPAARDRCGSTSRCRSRSTPPTCTSSTSTRVRRCASSVRVRQRPRSGRLQGLARRGSARSGSATVRRRD